jgi:aminopeptidase N
MVDGNAVMAMSYYPNEGNPLWSKYSTAAIIHTLNVYSRYTFAYPYPVAISVNGPVGGMEYPMICFNGPRPEEDGTYPERTKYGLISVVIHEVGHNYFPMIVNSDERQWTWMDEGLNTFLQYLAEARVGRRLPVAARRAAQHRRVHAVATGADHDQLGVGPPNRPQRLRQAGHGLNILRETVLGRELFDFAFKEYCDAAGSSSAPTPADFFRTMEDASGVDLDWFWRGWFYTTDHADQAIDGVKLYTHRHAESRDEKALQKKTRDTAPESLSDQRNAKLPAKVVDARPDSRTSTTRTTTST